MKVAIIALLALILAGGTCVLVLCYPQLKNMKSEYHTAQAIYEIQTFVEANQGRWPQSVKDLGNRYPDGGIVSIDYQVTSDELIEDLEKLKNSVRPRSGVFYTYPNYDRDIGRLHSVLKQFPQL